MNIGTPLFPLRTSAYTRALRSPFISRFRFISVLQDGTITVCGAGNPKIVCGADSPITELSNQLPEPLLPVAYGAPCTLWAPICHGLSEQLPVYLVPGGKRCSMRPPYPKLLTVCRVGCNPIAVCGVDNSITV